MKLATSSQGCYGKVTGNRSRWIWYATINLNEKFEMRSFTSLRDMMGRQNLTVVHMTLTTNLADWVIATAVLNWLLSSKVYRLICVSADRASQKHALCGHYAAVELALNLCAFYCQVASGGLCLPPPWIRHWMRIWLPIFDFNRNCASILHHFWVTVCLCLNSI